MTATEVFVDGAISVALDELIPNPDNPRSDAGDITELAATIATHGILQPLLVTPTADDRYMVIAGHRRLAALQSLDWQQLVPVTVREMTEAERMEVAVVENLQRQDLSPLDEGRGFAQLVELGHSQRQIAERVGCNQSHVSRRLSLTKLPDKAIELIADGKLQLRQAEEIAALPDTDVADVVAKVVKTAKSYATSGRELPGWVIPDAIRTVAETRKHDAAVAAGKASKLKRLTDDPRYSYGNQPFEKCKKAEATAWFVGGSDRSVVWARERTAATGKPASTEKPAWEIRRDRSDALVAERTSWIGRMIHDDPSELRRLGLQLVLDELRNNGHVGLIAPDLEEDGDFDTSMIAALNESATLMIAVAALNSVIERVWFEGDEAWREAQTRSRHEWWANLVAPTPATDANDQADAEWVAAARAEDPEINERFAGVDVSPDAAEAQVPEPDPMRPEDYYNGDVDTATTQAIHDDVVAERPAVLQRSPWTGYRAAKEANVVAKIGRLTDREKVRDVIAYEWAGKNLRRLDVLAAAVQRLTDLDFEQGVG